MTLRRIAMFLALVILVVSSASSRAQQASPADAWRYIEHVDSDPNAASAALLAAGIPCVVHGPR